MLIKTNIDILVFQLNLDPSAKGRELNIKNIQTNTFTVIENIQNIPTLAIRVVC